MSNIGFRVFQRLERPPQELVAVFKDFGVANVGDAMGRFRVMNYQIKSINKPGVKMAGPAVTVRVRPGDNLMLHKALDLAQEGDVLVVDAQESPLNGLWGEIMTKMAMKKKLAGLVMDGGVRDSYDIRELGFPVFTRAVIAAGGDKDGLGEVNVPVNCGGVPVNPGDIILGDDDGVVVVPRLEAETVARLTKEIMAKEAEMMKQIEEGTIDRSWVDKTLRQRGCEIID
ncbi:MAG: 4-carboxy-4-hydroxy-2-oxoadipate aldolase/oxaloacetate decarboxylase [Limnochordia bacterium]|jgi:regulator of RNase E activity RraA